jgi:FAD/FMN-containing dehydrogenase
MPGTRFVTVGGAIANDVHGKNQHRVGTFGCHVLAIEVARSDGARLTCSPHENADLFAATIGGLGLTGLILRATIQLRRVQGLAVEAEDIRFDSLDDFFSLAAESDADTAAWIDSLATGRSLGRGVFSRARQAPERAADPPARRSRVAFPVTPPISLINPLSRYAPLMPHTGANSAGGAGQAVSAATRRCFFRSTASAIGTASMAREVSTSSNAWSRRPMRAVR